MQIQKNALQDLYEVISLHITKQSDGIFTVAGDFNQTDLRSVLPVYCSALFVFFFVCVA